MRRVALFLDYQNVYMQARRCFAAGSAGPVEGQVDPVALAEMLVRRVEPQPCRVHQVRVYRGLPDVRRDPRGHAAVRRQTEAWQLDPRVRVLLRPLRYPPGYPRSRPQEKGVDVLLALDFALMAVREEYDVGILMSHDSDLAPALEAVVHLDGPACQVAAWAAPQRPGLRFSVPGRRIWCHYLTAADYAAVADPRDYTRP